MSFLKAEWRRLALLNYEVDAKVLEPFLPYKTELDTWNNIHYVSLVGFMFLNTRVLGFKMPYHINFEEINLRFYVKHHDGEQWKRGVVFIREIVPKPLITFVANTWYNEHYATRKMFHDWLDSEDIRETTYGYWEGDRKQQFTLKTSMDSQPIPVGSETEFITEHYWGYSAMSEFRTTEYEVTHPRWEAYAVDDYSIDFDFGLAYGEHWSFLNENRPLSAMLAEGSAITVESKSVIK